MSSHHVVRDQQEPAIFIQDTDSVNFEIVESLLEWSPNVIVQADQLDKVLAWGIKIDIVVGETFSKISRNKLLNKMPLTFLETSNDSQISSSVYNYLISKDYSALNILSGSTIDFDGVPNEINIVFFSYGWRWVQVTSGQYSKWMMKNQRLKLPVHIETKNLIEVADGIWNVSEDGIVMVQTTSNSWIGEEL